MSGFAHVKRCLDVTDHDVAIAVAGRSAARALLHRMAEVSRPGDGAPKVLLVLARMASSACDWIDGDLRIEIIGDGEVSVVEVLTDLGAGMRERVLPPFTLKVPLRELTASMERVPHMIAPLALTSRSTRRLVLSATAEVRRSSSPPPFIAIGDESLASALPPPTRTPSVPPPAPSRGRLPTVRPTASAAGSGPRPPLPVPREPSVIPAAHPPAPRRPPRP
jgi:hypothetical protein